jgi:hypothetical protein
VPRDESEVAGAANPPPPTTTRASRSDKDRDQKDRDTSRTVGGRWRRSSYRISCRRQKARTPYSLGARSGEGIFHHLSTPVLLGELTAAMAADPAPG